MEQYDLEIQKEEAGKRIDRFLSENLPQYSRSFWQKLIKEQKISVNESPVKSNYKTSPGDRVQAMVPDPEPLEIEPENIPLDILYEDGDVLIVNKPKGMVVHPGAGHLNHTLVNALLYHCRGNLSGINGILRPGIVHRIDQDTTGSLVVCKNDFAHNSLAEQLKVHSITRKYRAIVHGVIKEEEGTVDSPIGRHPIDRKKNGSQF